MTNYVGNETYQHDPNFPKTQDRSGHAAILLSSNSFGMNLPLNGFIFTDLPLLNIQHINCKYSGVQNKCEMSLQNTFLQVILYHQSTVLILNIKIPPGPTKKDQYHVGI